MLLSVLKLIVTNVTVMLLSECMFVELLLLFTFSYFIELYYENCNNMPILLHIFFYYTHFNIIFNRVKVICLNTLNKFICYKSVVACNVSYITVTDM